MEYLNQYSDGLLRVIARTFPLFLFLMTISQGVIAKSIIAIWSFSLINAVLLTQPESLSGMSGEVDYLQEVLAGFVYLLPILGVYTLIRFVADVLDTQVGLNNMNIAPNQEIAGASVFARLTAIVAITSIFVSGYHLVLFKYLYLASVPLNLQIHTVGGALMALIHVVGDAFLLGLLILMPLVLLYLFSDVASTLILKNIAGMNPYFIFLPARILVGLVLFPLIAPYLQQFIFYMLDAYE